MLRQMTIKQRRLSIIQNILTIIKKNTLQNIKAGTIITLLFVTPWCYAQSAVHQQIVELLNQQKPQAAYQLALLNVIQWEGETEFDLAYALAARAAGELEQAVFAFERLLENHQGANQVRYYLAVTYYEIGNLTAAEKQFTLLESNATKNTFKKQSQHYLKIIREAIKSKSGHWQNSLMFSTGYDDNANNGIKDEFINVPSLGTFKLFPQSRQIKSAYADMQAQLVYVKPQDQISSWYVGIDAQHINFNKQYAWSRTFAGVMAGYQSRWQKFDWDINAFYHLLKLDGDNYLNYGGVNANIAYPLTKISQTGLLLSYAQESYQKHTQLDKNQNIASLWYSNQINAKMQQKVDIRIGSEQADESEHDYISRDFWGASYQYQWRINRLLSFQSKLDYIDSKHLSIGSFSNIKQKVDLLRAEVQFKYQFKPQWNALLTLNHMQNNSNVILYDYERNKLQLSVKYDF